MAIVFDPVLGQFIDEEQRALWNTPLTSEPTKPYPTTWPSITPRTMSPPDPTRVQPINNYNDYYEPWKPDPVHTPTPRTMLPPDPTRVQPIDNNNYWPYDDPYRMGATPEEKANWVAPERNYEQEGLDWINGEATLGKRFPLSPTGTPLSPPTAPYGGSLSGDSWESRMAEEESRAKFGAARDRTASKYNTVRSLIGPGQ